MRTNSYSYSPTEMNSNIFQVILGVIITFLLIFILFSIYYYKIKKHNSVKIPHGYLFVFSLYVTFIRNFTIQILGEKNEKFTPFFIYLFSYILISNIISVFGLTNPTSSLSVTLSLGLVTFLGIFVIGIKYQKLSFLKKYTFNISKTNGKSIPVMVNPINIVGQFAPLISISFRLWGNIFAGSLIVTMVLSSTENLTNNMLPYNIFNVLGVFVLVPLHLYFDLLSGLIQTFVFMLLTLVYWKMEMVEKK